MADAVRRYLFATGDEEFEQGPGLDLLVATARLWRSLGHHDAEGGFRIDGVTGPDEYTALVNNNVFTNLMAARNLRTAAGVAIRHPQRAAELDVDEEEIAAWRDAADAMVIPYDEDLRITQQSEGFTRPPLGLREHVRGGVPAPAAPPQLPPVLEPGRQAGRPRVRAVRRRRCFDDEQKARDFDYYERITVRDSSLSAAIQAIVAADVGQLELAYDYWGETAFIDLRDLAFNTRDGIHLAALAGAWHVAVAGFGGLRDHGDKLQFTPRLPPRLSRLAFRIVFRGRRLRVSIEPEAATYELRRRGAARAPPLRGGAHRFAGRRGDAADP